MTAWAGVWTNVLAMLTRVLRLRPPGRADLPAFVVGVGLLVCAASALGAWGTAFCALGVLGVAASELRWPATVVAAAVVVAVAVDGELLLVVGLLTTAYLVLLSGVPSLDGAVTLVAGVGVATVVVAIALAVALPASIWWVLPAAAGVPLLLAVTAGPRAGRRG